MPELVEGLDLWIVVSGLIAPSTFWLGFLYYRDRYRPEPIRVLLGCYLLGLVAAVACDAAYEATEWVGLPADPFELARRDRAGFLLYAVLVVGVLEEGAKFLPFWLLARRTRHFGDEMDGIIYASAIALGFATAENLVYFHLVHGRERYLRALASPFVHMVFSSIWGYLYTRARLAGDRLAGDRLAGRRRFLPPALGFAAAAIAHGLYDFLALDPALGAGAAVVIFLLWIPQLVIVRRIQLKEETRLVEGQKAMEARRRQRDDG